MRVSASAPLAGANPLRFGWSRAKPPQYRLEISPSDVDAGLEPQQSLLEKIAQKLIRRDDLNRSGFALFSNLADRVPPARQETFFTTLTLKLQTYLEENFKAFFNPGNKALTSIRRHMQDGQVLTEGNLVAKTPAGNWTLKSPHFDRGAFVVMHQYHPTKNVSGGQFQVIDVNQFLHDHPTVALSQMVDAESKVLPAFWEALAPYSLTLNKEEVTGTALIFNNTFRAGVAHAATPVVIEEPSKPFKREYVRYTITPVTPERPLPVDVQRLSD